MPKKILISERQLTIITQHINESNMSIINENFKEITLSLLMLAGLGLSGQNKAIAQDALTRPDVIKKLDNILNDVNLLTQVTAKIDQQVPNSSELIEKNLYKIKLALNDMN